MVVFYSRRDPGLSVSGNLRDHIVNEILSVGSAVLLLPVFAVWVDARRVRGKGA